MITTNLKLFRKASLYPAVRSASAILIVFLSLSAPASDVVPHLAKTALPRSHWFQIGQASWYGKHFQGRRTATGEHFDMNLLTCAHKTLPLGTWIRVTNLSNGKSIFVRVNDRGPMVVGRIVDLSYAAAQRVGVTGLARVRLETVSRQDAALSESLAAQQVPRQMIAQVRLPTLPESSLER